MSDITSNIQIVLLVAEVPEATRYFSDSIFQCQASDYLNGIFSYCQPATFFHTLKSLQTLSTLQNADQQAVL